MVAPNSPYRSTTQAILEALQCELTWCLLITCLNLCLLGYALYNEHRTRIAIEAAEHNLQLRLSGLRTTLSDFQLQESRSTQRIESRLNLPINIPPTP